MKRTSVKESKSLLDQYDVESIQILLSGSLPLKRSFYERNAKVVAKDLLGKILVRELDGNQLAGFIVEVEAYKQNEPACHAHRGKTQRTEVMFGPGGRSYIYFVYGMYWCLNATAESEGKAAACLIRAIEPFSGLDIMRTLRSRKKTTELCSGPGKLTVAFNLTGELNDHDLSKPPLKILAPPDNLKPRFKGGKSGRIGINHAKDLQYRYFVQGNSHVSK